LSAGYEFESENYANDDSQQFDPAATSSVNVTQKSQSTFVQDQAQLFGGRLQLFRRVPGAVLRARHAAVHAVRIGALSRDRVCGASSRLHGGFFGRVFLSQIGTKLRAHAGRGYRAPSLFERFGVGFDPVFGYSVYGDPRLNPSIRPASTRAWINPLREDA